MNRMSATSTKIFASTAPEYGSRSLFTTPSDMPPISVPHRFPTPPNTTTMNESTMYCCPRFGPRVDPLGAHAHRARHRTVLRNGAHLQSERRLLEDELDQEEHRKREDDDV